MVLQFITSIFCLTYSILLRENPLIISNSILFVQITMLFVGKILYSHIYIEKENNINENIKKITSI